MFPCIRHSWRLPPTDLQPKVQAKPPAGHGQCRHHTGALTYPQPSGKHVATAEQMVVTCTQNIPWMRCILQVSLLHTTITTPQLQEQGRWCQSLSHHVRVLPGTFCTHTNVTIDMNKLSLCSWTGQYKAVHSLGTNILFLP